jgi:hypothetical protein
LKTLGDALLTMVRTEKGNWLRRPESHRVDEYEWRDFSLEVAVIPVLLGAGFSYFLLLIAPLNCD